MIDVTAPQVRLDVGVVIERRRSKNPWADYVWRPITALPGHPAATEWAMLSDDGDVAQFFCGIETITLYRTETGHYRDNLRAAAPSLWVALRPTASEPPYLLVAVTADPAEGESFTQAGEDLVGSVPLPEAIGDVIAAFVQAHPPRTTTYKRRRDDSGSSGAAAAS